MDLLDRLKLDHPVAQAGMGNMAPAELAAAVARAGGMGTIGMCAPSVLPVAIDRVRQEAPGRAVVVNLLMPFARVGHIDACIGHGADAVVLAFGGDVELVGRLRTAGIMVLVLVGTEEQAHIARNVWGVDGLIAQGNDAGGHLRGRIAAQALLPAALGIAKERPVLLAGGVADAIDTRAALDAGGTERIIAAHASFRPRVRASWTGLIGTHASGLTGTSPDLPV